MANKSKTRENLPAISTSSMFYGKFKNDSSDNLAVNGSVTPVVFTLEDLDQTQEFLLERVTFVIESDSNINLNNFANLTSLLNGISFSANGNTESLAATAMIQNNGDVLLISTDTTINTIRKSSTEDVGIISGNWDFTESYSKNAPVIVNNDLKIIINDDLSLVEFFKVSCHAILLE